MDVKASRLGRTRAHSAPRGPRWLGGSRSSPPEPLRSAYTAVIGGGLRVGLGLWRARPSSTESVARAWWRPPRPRCRRRSVGRFSRPTLSCSTATIGVWRPQPWSALTAVPSVGAYSFAATRITARTNRRRQVEAARAHTGARTASPTARWGAPGAAWSAVVPAAEPSPAALAGHHPRAGPGRASPSWTAILDLHGNPSDSTYAGGRSRSSVGLGVGRALSHSTPQVRPCLAACSCQGTQAGRDQRVGAGQQPSESRS